jgi:uncharacterized protein (UPF0332 family)
MSRLSSDLLKSAAILASPNRGTEASFRRSISTAYYGWFHFLLDESCRILIGPSLKDQPLRDALSRCFKHHSMLKAFECLLRLAAKPNSIPAYAPFAVSIRTQATDIQIVGAAFKDLYDLRQRADYDLTVRLTRVEALKSIGDAKNAMNAWNRVKKADRGLIRLFAVMPS